jgi:hypothetical protein
LDAHFLLNSPGGIDWPDAIDAVKYGRLELPLYLMLEFLAHELSMPIPSTVLDELGEVAGQAEGARRDLALYAARQIQGQHPYLESRRPGGWRGRLKAQWWRLFPSWEYLRFAFGPRSRLQILLLYLTRPWTFAWSELIRLAARALRPSRPQGVIEDIGKTEVGG